MYTHTHIQNTVCALFLRACVCLIDTYIVERNNILSHHSSNHSSNWLYQYLKNWPSVKAKQFWERVSQFLICVNNTYATLICVHNAYTIFSTYVCLMHIPFLTECINNTYIYCSIYVSLMHIQNMYQQSRWVNF